ncbi:MAG: hypothetical protein HY023_05225 [Chloroflexi bacterium]|nr:hypothetical protein [Chloroflexota bacterium]MBI3762189.1 hypothetical protein [Chloroflexota bacterium]
MDRREFRRQQLIGVITGLVGGIAAASYWPELRDSLGWYGVVLWGGVIGGVIASLPKFGVVGQRVTHSGNSTLNFIVGTLLLVGVVFVLFTVAGLVLR